jgi:Tfp pilus assembly protein PilX
VRTRSARRDEEGSVLILALVFIVLFGIVVSMMLSYASANFGLSSGEVTKSHQLYAADGAVQYATQQVKATNGNSCPVNMTGGGLNLTSSSMALQSDVSTVNVTFA